MTTAIHYTSVRTPAESGKVFGLQVAVINWLKAYMRYSKQETFPFLVSDETSWHEARDVALESGIDPNRLMALDARFPRENAGRFTTIFRADSDSRQLFWQRELSPSLNFNFCGLAHAIAGMEGGQVLEQYCLAPATASDAIVCPSRAIQAAIRSFWDMYSDYIERRFGNRFHCDVQLPLIPLGIDAAHFAARVAPDKRKAQRMELGLADDDTAVLWVGRLSHAIKAHPLAMFRAVEEAARLTGKRVHLLMLGYFMPTEAAEQFRALALDICKTAQVSFIASDDARFPDGLWAAGDIFMSLVDNMQESFGLTPIEAIAAGLPRVISDWNGYRDCVRHGEDGFLVQTTQPPPGTGGDIAAQLLCGREIYGGFLAKTAQSVAVDHFEAAAALVTLIENPSLRQRIATKARERLGNYDWNTIIPAYESLWQELSARRQMESAQTRWPAIPPQVPDPFGVYAGYPTHALAESDRLQTIATTDEIALLWRHEINVLALDIMIGIDDVAKALLWISQQPGQPTIGSLLKHFSAFDPAQIWRTLGWLAKLGIIKIIR